MTVPPSSSIESACPSSDRVTWNSDKLHALLTHFEPDIKAGAVALQSVREKVEGIDDLKDIGYPKVYDRLRKEVFT